MKRYFALFAAASMFFATVGCDEAQYDAAVENYNDEVIEAENELDSAVADDVLTDDEIDDLQDANEDVREAAGEVVEQQGDLIESNTD